MHLLAFANSHTSEKVQLVDVFDRWLDITLTLVLYHNCKNHASGLL